MSLPDIAMRRSRAGGCLVHLVAERPAPDREEGKDRCCGRNGGRQCAAWEVRQIREPAQEPGSEHRDGSKRWEVEPGGLPCANAWLGCPAVCGIQCPESEPGCGDREANGEVAACLAGTGEVVSAAPDAAGRDQEQCRNREQQYRHCLDEASGHI